MTELLSMLRQEPVVMVTLNGTMLLILRILLKAFNAHHTATRTKILNASRILAITRKKYSILMLNVRLAQIILIHPNLINMEMH